MPHLSFFLFFFLAISFCHCHAQNATESPPSTSTSTSEPTSNTIPTSQPTPIVTIPTTAPTSTSTPTIPTTTSTVPTPTPTPTPTSSTPFIPSNIPTPTSSPTPSFSTSSIPSSTGTGTGPSTGTWPSPTLLPSMCNQQRTCLTCTLGCYWCSETETCYAQNSTYTCTDIGWKSSPQQCLLPQWNPFLTQDAILGNINASNAVWTINIPPVDAIGNFVYFQVETLTPDAPRLTILLRLRMPDGSMRTWQSARLNDRMSYITIHPSRTGSACLASSRRTCDFIIQIQSPGNYFGNTNNVDFRMSASGGLMLDVDVQLSTYTSNDTVVLFGLELYPAALDVKITLRPTAFNSKTDLDLYVAHESWVNQYQYPDHQAGRGSNEEESFIIGQNLYQSGLFIIAVAPAQIDPSRKSFDIIIVRNFKNEFIFGLSTLGIIAAIAILILCIFSAVAIIAKRRRRLFLSMQASQLIGGAGGGVAQGPPVPTGATPEELELIPIHPYKKEIVREDDALCSICLAAYEPSQTLRTLPCHHHFHQSCIDPWLSQHRTCPNCRQSAIPDKAQATSLAAAVANGLGHSHSSRSPSAEPAPLVMNDEPRRVEPVTVSPSHSHSHSASSHRVNVGASPVTVTVTDLGHSAVTVSIHSSNTPSTPDNDASLSRSVRRLSHPRHLHMDDSKQDSHS